MITVQWLYFKNCLEKIETIKAGNKTISAPGAISFNAIKSSVASWLDDHSSFNSVTDVLQKGSDSQIAQIISHFSGEPYLY